MHEIEDLLRSSLRRNAEDATPRSEAMREAVLAVRRRRRARSTLGIVAAAAAVGVIAGGAIAFRGLDRDALETQSVAVPRVVAPQLPAATTPSTAATTPSTAATTIAATSVAVMKQTLLASVFGSDYSVQPKSPSGFGGDLSLTANSASAKGLPAGYEAVISVDLLGPTTDSGNGVVDTITALCEPMQEKGASSNGCTTQTVGGLTVHRYVMEGPNTKVGTFETLRFLYLRPDKKVQYAEVTIWTTSHTTTVAERASGSTWVNAQADKVRAAAIGSLG